MFYHYSPVPLNLHNVINKLFQNRIRSDYLFNNNAENSESWKEQMNLSTTSFIIISSTKCNYNESESFNDATDDSGDATDDKNVALEEETDDKQRSSSSPVTSRPWWWLVWRMNNNYLSLASAQSQKLVAGKIVT